MRGQGLYIDPERSGQEEPRPVLAGGRPGPEEAGSEGNGTEFSSLLEPWSC